LLELFPDPSPPNSFRKKEERGEGFYLPDNTVQIIFQVISKLKKFNAEKKRRREKI
jgi:hypothetical protein